MAVVTILSDELVGDQVRITARYAGAVLSFDLPRAELDALQTPALRRAMVGRRVVEMNDRGRPPEPPPSLGYGVTGDVTV